jgi:biotin carboxyl carrier protein
MNDFVVSLNGSKYNVKILSNSELILDDKKYSFELITIGNNSYFLKLDNVIFELTSQNLKSDLFRVLLKGYNFDVIVRTALQEKAVKLLENSEVFKHHHQEIKAPMPGLILKIRKKVGDKVEQGESVIILEAMKMENDIKAPASGVIENISISEGSPVEKGITLFSIE